MEDLWLNLLDSVGLNSAWVGRGCERLGATAGAECRRRAWGLGECDEGGPARKRRKSSDVKAKQDVVAIVSNWRVVMGKRRRRKVGIGTRFVPLCS